MYDVVITCGEKVIETRSFRLYREACQWASSQERAGRGIASMKWSDTHPNTVFVESN